MSYQLVTLAALCIFLLMLGWRLNKWFHSRGASLSGYSPLATFEAQRDAGLSSSAFDIEANIRDTDTRSGLDPRDAQEIQDIMRSQGVSFDRARLIRQEQYLARNGIDPSGMPLDAKAVTRL